uniref:Uncharacterized protein n=1 Tax=Arundo donax TaxID=35708 RepID=A0A0A9HFX4_ARUDO
MRRIGSLLVYFDSVLHFPFPFSFWSHLSAFVFVRRSLERDTAEKSQERGFVVRFLVGFTGVCERFICLPLNSSLVFPCAREELVAGCLCKIRVQQRR